MTDYYTYIVYTQTGYFYIGVRTKGTIEDLWYTYFTSSKTVKQYVKDFGKDFFTYRIINTYDDEFQAKYAEYRLIRKFIHHPYCLNRRVPDQFPISNECINAKRKQKIGPNGETEYLLSGRKTAATKHKKGLDGLTGFQRAGKVLQKTLKNNPGIVEKRTRNRLARLDERGPDGLTPREKISISHKGDKNPAKRPEVREKISKSIKKWAAERTPDEIKRSNEKIQQTREKLGLNKKHSKFMTENNPAKGTRWYTNGKDNLRISETDEIPEGFTPGRVFANKLKRKFHKCTICGKEGYGPNMKRHHFDNCKQKR